MHWLLWMLRHSIRACCTTTSFTLSLARLLIQRRGASGQPIPRVAEILIPDLGRPDESHGDERHYPATQAFADVAEDLTCNLSYQLAYEIESQAWCLTLRGLAGRPGPVGHDIRRGVGGYLASARRMILQTAEAHQRNIRSTGLRTPSGATVEDVGVDHRGADIRWPSSSWTVRMPWLSSRRCTVAPGRSPPRVFRKQALETAVGHEPGERDGHVQGERHPRAHERERDRRGIEHERDLGLKVGAERLVQQRAARMAREQHARQDEIGGTSAEQHNAVDRHRERREMVLVHPPCGERDKREPEEQVHVRP